MTTSTNRRTSNRTEEIEQARLIKWTHKVAVRELMPELRWLFHTPNGGTRTPLAGAQMKALGVKPGVPDLLLPVRIDANTPGLVIEMKSATGSTSPEQKEWLKHLGQQGWIVAVARSAQEARKEVCQYLDINPDLAPPLDA